MNWPIILTLILIGWLLLFLEIFFIPGVTILIVIGCLMMLAGIYFSFDSYGIAAGWYTIGGTVLLLVLSLYFAFKSGFWKRLSLHESNNARVNEIDENHVKVGMEAISVSKIAPSGKAMFGENAYEVHSMEGYINENTPLIVVKISMNKIFVKPK